MSYKDKDQHTKVAQSFGTPMPIRNFHNPLNKEEQLELYEKIKQGDKEAKNIVISSCLPLVVRIAQNFRVNNKHIDIDDLIQEGNIALIKAVGNWDINKGGITTVATWYVKNALIDMIHDCKYQIKYPYSLSRRASEDLRKIKKIYSNNINYIAKQTGLSKKKVKKLLHICPHGAHRMHLYSQSNRFLEIGNEDEQEVEKKPCLGDLIELINNNLTGDQKTIFCMWSGVFKKRIGPKQIAKSLGKSEQYVYDNIYGAKRILSRIAKKAQANA